MSSELEPTPADDSHPWGVRNKLGLPTAFVQNATNIITQPKEFFGKVAPESEWFPALAYGVLIGILGGLLGLFWQFLFSGFSLFGGQTDAAAGFAATGLFQTILVVVFVPLGVVAGIFINSGLIHLFLLLTDWLEHSYGATLKAISFSQTAGLASIIPFCGGLITTVWMLVLEAIGLKRMHNLSTGQATITVLIPLLVTILCCLLPIIGIAVAVALGPQAADFFNASGGSMAVLW